MSISQNKKNFSAKLLFELRACCPLGWRNGQPMLPRSQLTSWSFDAPRLATAVGETLDPLYRQ